MANPVAGLVGTSRGARLLDVGAGPGCGFHGGAAGSYGELRDGALPVSPEHTERSAEALHAALSLTPAERRERAERLRQAVLRHDLRHRLDLLLDDLIYAGAEEAAPVSAY